ncbi:arf-GAP domain and FG repeat-containing protein 1-like isoform X2 [Pomacea canaliculata]|uniref:arf-GAP domain and FG repeat-containing protein 1-like isoform X2 n=1 Tax=Pomacea canaliculata TaxID=400727 RepID=UPI000D73C07C|nr:arf-GAP domain and FG repeat-containing protein 1-like isoform X2 [Pomacea canaliculata]
MASNKRKQDEKHLKMLREMVALPSNKTCFDCHQRGPTYVNMTIGSFVCTSCSGILRGLNPPHRVKSISMASFTPEEMDFLKSHGNELNRKVYLGLYDNRTWPEPDSRDEQRVRDFMVQKYENKRFYVAPTEAMREEARHMNEAALSKQPQTKPLRSLLGENATKLVVGSSQQAQVNQNGTQAGAQPPSTMAAARPVAAASTPAPVQAPALTAKTSGFDLLGDLSNDPFASSAPQSSSSSAGGFADFDSFGATAAAPITQSSQPVQSSAPTTFPISNTPLQPFASSGSLQPLSATPLNSATAAAAPPPPASTATSFSAISDKYAALADLDSSFNTTPVQTTTINWGGSEPVTGGPINWGTAGSSGTSLGQPSSGLGDTGSALNWTSQGASSSASPSNLGMNWNSSIGSAPFAGGGVLGASSTVANPFGTSAPTLPQTANLPGSANPFATPVPASYGQPATVSTAAGFGYQPYTLQNGGFGMPSTATGFAYSTAAPTFAAPQGYQTQTGMAPAQGFGMQPPVTAAFGVQQPGFAGGWGQMGGNLPPHQPSVNPFMVGTPPHNSSQMPSSPFGQP